LAAGALSLRLPPPSLLVSPVLLGKAVPSRQFFDGVAEEGVLVIVWGLVKSLQAPSKILFEVVEFQN